MSAPVALGSVSAAMASLTNCPTSPAGAVRTASRAIVTVLIPSASEDTTKSDSSRRARRSHGSTVYGCGIIVWRVCQPAPSVSPQLIALFTSAAIVASTSAVSSLSANAVGHMEPWSRFALSLKPSVAYLVLNFCAGWKWQRTSPSFA